MEVEDLTESRVQRHIARICIHTKTQYSIDEVIEFMVSGEPFYVRVLEDMAEIVDFGPRYNGDDGNSHVTSDSEDDKGIEEREVVSDDESFVQESPMLTQGKWKTTVNHQSGLSLRGLQIVDNLNAL